MKWLKRLIWVGLFLVVVVLAVVVSLPYLLEDMGVRPTQLTDTFL